MKEFEIKTTVRSYQIDELPEELRNLVLQAKENTRLSYSPYSHFRVGAAVLLEDGQVFNGANQENAAYPSGLCAERTAMFYANANCPNTPVKAIACAGRNIEHFTAEPVSPCGNCRQVLLETEHRFGKDITILLSGENEIFVFPSAKSLLPHYFVDENMN